MENATGWETRGKVNMRCQCNIEKFLLYKVFSSQGDNVLILSTMRFPSESCVALLSTWSSLVLWLPRPPKTLLFVLPCSTKVHSNQCHLHCPFKAEKFDKGMAPKLNLADPIFRVYGGICLRYKKSPVQPCLQKVRRSTITSQDTPFLLLVVIQI